MNCTKNCVKCAEAECALHPLKDKLKHCPQCDALEVLTITEYSAIASCPNNHYARALRAASNVWAAMGC